MRQRVVSIITAPVRLLRRLLALVLRLLPKRSKGATPADTPVTLVAPVTSVPATAGKPARRIKLRGKPDKAAQPPPTPVTLDKPAGRRSRNPLVALKGLARLKGKPRIAAFVVLGVAVVVVVIALRPSPSSEKDVRAALDTYAAATRAKDYQTLCDDLFARDIVDGLKAQGLPCEVALRSSTLRTLRNPRLQVLGVEVTGDQALARTRSTASGEQPSLDTIKLVREDDRWRIASLSEPGTETAPQAAPPATP